MCFRVIAKVGLLLTLLCCYIHEVSGEGSSEEGPPIPDDEKVQNLNDLLTKRVSDWGFNLRTYEVFTEDDYILKIHRIFKNEEDLRNRSPVIIMHGISACSANYLAYRKSLAYYLAERGYDVWLGNGRGNAFSIKHKDMVNMSPQKKKFWDFSFHEIGYFDLPAFLHKIKEVTGSDSVHYVGMSMGTTVFLVMASTRHSVVKDIASVTLLAPVARPKHFEAIESKTNQVFITAFAKFVRFVGRGDIYTYRKSIANALYKACKSKGWSGKLCEKFLRSQSKGKDLFDFNDSVETFIFFPCGSAVKAFQHFIQMAQAGKFQQYDHGKTRNREKYKQDLPPEYDLSSIDKEIHLLVGGEDTQADKRDVLWLHERLPKSQYISEGFEHFDHRDFEYGIELDSAHEAVLKVVEAHEEGRVPDLSVDITILDQSDSEKI